MSKIQFLTIAVVVVGCIPSEQSNIATKPHLVQTKSEGVVDVGSARVGYLAWLVDHGDITWEQVPKARINELENYDRRQFSETFLSRISEAQIENITVSDLLSCSPMPAPINKSKRPISCPKNSMRIFEENCYFDNSGSFSSLQCKGDMHKIFQSFIRCEYNDVPLPRLPRNTMGCTSMSFYRYGLPTL